MTPHRLEAPPAGWDLLLERDPNASPTHRPEVWAALAAALPGMRPCFIAAEEDGRMRGGAPVLIERRAGMHWLHALPFLLPGTPLAEPGAHRAVDAAVAEGLASLQRELGAVGGEWALYRPQGPPLDPAAAARVSGENRMFETAVIDLDQGLEPVRRRMNRKTRQELGRARANGLTFGEEPGVLADAYALHLSQSRGWSWNRPPPLELLRRLMHSTAAGVSPVARLFTVRDARGLLTAALVLDHRHESMVWWSGSHRDARERHAFGFLLWSIAEWAQRAGRARLNLGASGGSEAVWAFKRALGATGQRYPVRWLDARHATPVGRLAAGIQARLRRGRVRGEPA